MKFILSATSIILVLHNIQAEEELSTKCEELKGSLFETASSLVPKKKYKGTKFYFGLRKENSNEGFLEINGDILSALKNEDFQLNGVFDVSLKTYVIIHGYKSNFKNPWVLEMKEKILKKENVNVILVDWSDGSNSWDYIESVRTSPQVSKDLAQLFSNMKSKVPQSKRGSNSWNHLYLIGHSLGAHIAGQTGHRLKKESNFFKIERITGLDPARPCFLKAALRIKLDKTDADFVDIIHTQTSQGDKKFGLGLREPIGHADFYVNGGVMQPACYSNTEWLDMACSHKMSHKYYMESMNETKSCKFEGHPWDQTYNKAIEIFKQIKNKKPCKDCAVMGKNASKKNSGTYLVLTSAKAPFCALKDDDFEVIAEKLELLKPPKDEESMVDIFFKIFKKK